MDTNRAADVEWIELAIQPSMAQCQTLMSLIHRRTSPTVKLPTWERPVYHISVFQDPSEWNMCTYIPFVTVNYYGLQWQPVKGEKLGIQSFTAFTSRVTMSTSIWQGELCWKLGSYLLQVCTAALLEIRFLTSFDVRWPPGMNRSIRCPTTPGW